MKCCAMLVAVLVCLTVTGLAELKSEPKVKVMIVKIEEMDQQVTHQTMSPEDFKKLEAELKAEAKFFSQAVELARKEWEKDKEYRRNPFPKADLKPRKAIAGPVMDEDRAADKLSNIEEQARDRAAEDATKEAEKAKARADRAKNKEKAQKDAKKKQERDAERVKLLATAVDMVKTKIEELKNAKPAAAQ